MSPDSFGRQAFQGLQGLGESITKAGDRIQHAEDAVNAIKVAGDFDIAQAQAVTDIAQHPAISQHADMLSVKSDEIHDEILKNNPGLSPAVQHVLAKHVASKRAPATIELLHAGQVKRAQQALVAGNAEKDRLVQQAAMDPRMTQHNMLVANDIRSLQLNAGLINDVQAQKDKEDDQHKFFSTFAQTRPQEFLDVMKVHELTGSVPEGMDAQHKSSYINTAYNALAGDRAEQARQERLLKEQRAAEVEYTRQGFVDEWAKGTLKTSDILSSNLEASGDGSKEHYIKLMQAREKQHAEPFVKDASLMADTLQKIRDRKITSNDQIERIYINSAKRNHGITDEDMMKLRTELEQGRTPDGQLIGTRKQRLLDGVRPSIDRSIFGQKSDEAGSALFLQYQEWVDSQLNEYKRQGKNPHDLLDPNNKDLWLGRPSAIAPYQRSMRDTIQEMTDKFKRPDRAAVPDAKKRLEGETPSQYLERMKKK